jgi:lipopolysaccharide export system protein LptA
MLLCFVLYGTGAGAQKREPNQQTVTVAKKDTSDKMLVSIDRAHDIVGFRTDSGDFRKIIGDVILRQGTDTLYCDSAVQNLTTKNFEAFGHVKIAQAGGTKGTSDYLKYTSLQKLAYMRGNVALTDGKNNLVCEELTYDLGTKIAVYDNWGMLHNDSTTVTSKKGIYNSNEKNAHFLGTVYIKDPQYKINSEDLVYNTETKVTQFYAKSTVVRDSGKSILQTSDGWYDGTHGIAHFLGRTSIWNDGQYIEADTALNYDRQTGYGVATGHVISIDTEHHSTVFCGHLNYFQKQRKLWATINPVLMQVNGKDTLYMAADTFYSAPMQHAKYTGTKIPNDTVENADGTRPQMKAGSSKKDTAAWSVPVAEDKKSKGKKKNKSKKTVSAEVKVVTDTATADTTAPLYFIGYHHVLIFSDSLQGKCDSVSYTRSDSMIRMMYNPIAWSHNSQITGDTILMQLDSSSIKKMFVPNNAFVVSQSGPEKAKLFDQIQGKTLTAWFHKSEITKMLVRPNAEAIYYNKDDKGAYISVAQTTSTELIGYFTDQKITKIKLDTEHNIKMTPLDQADLPGMKLSKFKWLRDQRPKSKEELFKR